MATVREKILYNNIRIFIYRNYLLYSWDSRAGVPGDMEVYGMTVINWSISGLHNFSDDFINGDVRIEISVRLLHTSALDFV